MKRFVLVASVAVVFLLSMAWAQTPATGTVNGTVTLNGTAVANAAVVLSSSGDSSYTVRLTTDANGNFSAANAPVGTVEAKAYDSQGGFLVGGTAILSKAGDVISLPLNATR